MFKPFTSVNLSGNILLRRHLNVDSYFIRDFRFCIASGTRRDLANGECLKKIESLNDYIEFKKFKPASNRLKNIVTKVARNFVISNEEDFSKLLKVINSEIMIYNHSFIGDKTDYLSKDYFGMSACGGEIKGDKLSAFNIGDSNILVLDKFYNILYRTKDDIRLLSNIREEEIRKRVPYITDSIDEHWNNDKEFRVWFRKEYINTDNEFAYGSLNGNEKALEHINYYEWYVKNAKYILAYTGGFEEVLKNENNIVKLIKAKKFKPKINGTLIGFIKE